MGNITHSGTRKGQLQVLKNGEHLIERPTSKVQISSYTTNKLQQAATEFH